MTRSFLLAALLLGACQAQPAGRDLTDAQASVGNGDVDVPNAPVSSDDPSPSADGTAAARPSRDCPIMSSSDWAAWINAMPGPRARPTLIVTGKATVPTGGYRFELADVQVMESYPVQVVVHLRQLPSANPGAPATQMVETHDMRGEWPIEPPVGSVTVRCGSRVLARISPVETAH